MIWQDPLAWFGLVVLAVPIVIHLLGRRHARVQPFPTLRFLEPARLLLTRRTRLTDLGLLALRLAILAAAVAALARPFLLTPERQQQLNRALARAIVLDTSLSMQRAALPGGSLLDAGRQEAQRLAGEAATSIVVESAAPRLALAGAAAWLQMQPGRRELVLVSDFQVGMMEAADLEVVPAEIGLQLARVTGTVPDSAALDVTVARGAGELLARVTLAQAETQVAWSIGSVAAPVADDNLLVLAGAAEQGRARAARLAARAIAPRSAGAPRAIAIVYPEYEGQAALLRSVQPFDQPWMASLSARLRADSTLVAAAWRADVQTDTAFDQLVTLARTDAGKAVVLGARGSIDGQDHLLLFCRADAGSLASAALLAAVSNALQDAPPVIEREPAHLSDAQLQDWGRAAATVAAPHAANGQGAADGRWLWLLVLVLLACESWLRRGRSPTLTAERAA